ncbi:RNA ligase [Orpheovirus IHUMI-LCC2]|uniref:RNA ligase n=1 Tax=Orpheovirus IHUMI-LCC2 TaxID=2023057 RepID=A0A2I2L3D5_9VIRU|nr:RNA ligase [Orpheovirus IHUMI-LCC2]SNW62027.1 RNA ligase [Orpheovirus IHUMI-LCC2]
METKYPPIGHLSNNDKFKTLTERNVQMYIEEKIDGSQLSFYLVDDKLKFVCKGKEIEPGNISFNKTILLLEHHLINNRLNDNYIYHGEALSKKRHNVIKYSRLPKCCIVIYDIYDIKTREWLDYNKKKEECNRLGLECVKLLYMNDKVETNMIDKCNELINKIEDGTLYSQLSTDDNKCNMEGVVLKHHNFYDQRKEKTSAVKLKLVSENFKERHKKPEVKDRTISWDNEIGNEVTELLKEYGLQFNTEARFRKAYQRVRDNGEKITYDAVVRDLDVDFDKEYMKETMVYLYAHLSQVIKRYGRSSLSEWYKNQTLI